MSFLQQKIIPRGYIAAPPKRLNSISEIGLKPALPNLPRPYVKRANIDPFEQHYVTPFIRMFDEEEAEKAKNKAKTDEQKAAAKYSIGNRIANATDNPLETLYNLVTLPTEITHALERKINTGNETARELKVIAAEDEDEENANYQDEKDKVIRQTVDEISTFVRRTGGLPKWGIRKLQALKEKYFPTDVDVSSDLQAWNKEEEERRLQREAASQQMQGLITSKFQQKGYKERMDATESVQTLLKAQAVQKEQERQQEAAKALQELLLGIKTQQKAAEEEQRTLQQPIVQQKPKKRLVARRQPVEKSMDKEDEEEEKVTATKRKRKWYDDDHSVREFREKKPHVDVNEASEQPPSFNLDLKQNEQDVRDFLNPELNPKAYRRKFEPDKLMQAQLMIYLRNRKKPESTSDLISYDLGKNYTVYFLYVPEEKQIRTISVYPGKSFPRALPGSTYL